ncbi:MAG: aldo/keto reductase [Candidatus Obscuribacterales bacterium]|nr:aldo/keto reductase [Candidatus Obscuribacterales bacterium]
MFGQTGMNVSVLGFGGAEIGFEGAGADTVEKILNTALDEGLNVIDTAECYVDSEELIGKAVSHRRNEYYLFTKCGHDGSYERDAWGKKDLAASIDRSLKRLRTDYVDLIQLHSCSAGVLRQGEAIEVLQAAKKAGKTRFIGYSGDNEDAAYAVNTGAFDTLQTSVNIADQKGIDKIIPLARERNMGIIAKRPVANAVWKNKSKPDYFYVIPYWERLQELKYDFCSLPLAESVAHALRFTLSVPGVHTAIVGTSKAKRWQENAEQLKSSTLSEKEFAEIRKRWEAVARTDWHGQV